MVEGLVRGYVPDVLAADLDFSALQRVNPKFHSGRRSATRREGDVVWRLPFRTEADRYLYLSIEFQSESDWWMAVRTQIYQGLLWQQVIQEKKLKRGMRLPPLLLLVLYNGTQRWSAETELCGLIRLGPRSTLWPWQPQVRYCLIDIGALVQNKPVPRDSPVDLLFRLERPCSPLQLKALVDEVIEWFRRHKGFPELKRTFTELVGRAIRSVAPRMKVPNELFSMRSNLETIGQVWKEQWLAEGEAKGLARGEAKGLAKGEAKGLARGEAKGLAKGKGEALVSLLVSKFGSLSPSILKRIRGAKLASIERWFKRALDAHDLPSVFDVRG
jgi:hypothetical protein